MNPKSEMRRRVREFLGAQDEAMVGEEAMEGCYLPLFLHIGARWQGLQNVPNRSHSFSS